MEDNKEYCSCESDDPDCDECYVCKKKHYCLEDVCCDCCVLMCAKCKIETEGEPKCGCYGKCDICNDDVDRGSNGWPCGKCKSWICEKESCIIKNNEIKKCVMCKYS